LKNSASDLTAQSLGFAVRLAHRAFDRALQRRIAPHGISPSQWYCLRALWEEDGLTQRQLSRATGVAENTITVTVASMVRDGLVTRTRSSEDKRRQVIALTGTGLEPGEQARFLAAIAKMTANLLADEPEGEGA
jgi:DNA-binding MarR family transcriptional regulator